MSPNKTLYIREEDQDAWSRADAAAHAAHQSLSQYLTGLIRRYAPAVPPTTRELQKITVDIGDGARMWTEGFTGRWLAWAEGPAGEWYQGIALTSGGQFAWYESAPGASEGRLVAYTSLDDLQTEVQEANWPDGDPSGAAGQEQFRALLAAAAEALGQDHVIWRDI